METMDIMPITTSYYPIDNISENEQLIMNNDIIIRNNYLEADYEYNNVNYYTSKIKA